MERFVGIGEAADALGVSISTLRRWEAEGKLAAEHTPGGHRRYDLAKLRPEQFRARGAIWSRRLRSRRGQLRGVLRAIMGAAEAPSNLLLMFRIV